MRFLQSTQHSDLFFRLKGKCGCLAQDVPLSHASTLGSKALSPLKRRHLPYVVLPRVGFLSCTTVLCICEVQFASAKIRYLWSVGMHMTLERRFRAGSMLSPITRTTSGVHVANQILCVHGFSPVYSAQPKLEGRTSSVHWDRAVLLWYGSFSNVDSNCRATNCEISGCKPWLKYV